MTRRFDIKVIFNVKDLVRAFKERFRLMWEADISRCGMVDCICDNAAKHESVQKPGGSH
jgi:hypothetical protein